MLMKVLENYDHEYFHLYQSYKLVFSMEFLNLFGLLAKIVPKKKAPK